MRYRILLLFVVVGLVVGVLFTIPQTIHAYPESHYLNVPAVAQPEGSNWCWAASLRSIMGYYGTWKSQCDIVKVTWGFCASWMYGWPDNRIKNTLNHYNFHSDTTGVTPFSTIISEIGAHDRPMYIRRMWSWNYGHAMVLSGYTTEDGLQLVERMDPGGGYFDMHSYDWFVSDGGWEWEGTVYHIYP